LERAYIQYGSYVAKIERIWQGVDPMVTADKAAVVAAEKKVDVVLVDATGSVGRKPAMAQAGAQGVRACRSRWAQARQLMRIEQGDFIRSGPVVVGGGVAEDRPERHADG
jgi:hypothetical protein